ncbi:alpha-L-rhamnosidase-related protein [Mucilaginibacter xinganensis]|uniref:Alpha-L-rhamnosidase six-hairpin glycosidase domain-containing protein n=1 Tax=Mucilaginibacter xinganensis TaxID=1234841 RepID=A0A223NXY5_9SPHI|nr:trehalase family glycosidase [Mucilaginibacter xinganensis]ASU34723.1 hypothetical protein MuYL_2836 [Mucilaginibacter xinganensis]
MANFMFYRKTNILLCVFTMLFLGYGIAGASTSLINKKDKTLTIKGHNITMVLSYGGSARITSLLVNGRKVISSVDGIFTSVNVGGKTYSSLQLKAAPALIKTKNGFEINGIRYGGANLTITEDWIFTTTGKAVKWRIERKFSEVTKVEETYAPVFNFDSINTWEGAYQGYGGLAWFYLFNEKLCTYGVHTRSSSFWDSKTGNGLNITVEAPGQKVAMKYTRTGDDRLYCGISVSDKDMTFRLDSGTNRRRFIRNSTNVWAPFERSAAKESQTITLSYFDFNEKYGRGKFVGINGGQVSAVLNTIARIGVIDSLHFGGNSWHTPYGPICLHEQYIAQLGLGINDPEYLKGYKSCLDFYRDHAIKPDGRVFSRWAYTDEDMMPGQGNKDGFYEAQWGILMDSNPDFVTNVAELYDMTGDKAWVKKQQPTCEQALNWIIDRDTNGNGLVEMMTDLQSQHKSSDWIDIIWASYENAFVNAKLYHALVNWAAIERQLGNDSKANGYEKFAARLKVSFNKPTSEGGFWDEEKKCYVHWIDKDKTVHGRNMVTPVNFMAIAYGICDNNDRRKLILDGIETQMEQEKLFFWPLAMTTYAPGEGKASQYPFPSYENGDLFLSWGSVAVKAYAEYKPELAVKYVKNVLNQYSKDGLAFQRYSRVKQDGQGDDILSGNSLSIVGLYHAIYGINPLYNRFYLNPHITPELAGTALKCNFRGQRLTIKLDNNRYSVSNEKFKIVSGKDFGFNAKINQLNYFEGNNTQSSLQAITEGPLTLIIKKPGNRQREWVQNISKISGNTISYVAGQLTPDVIYKLIVNGKIIKTLKSSAKGDVSFNTDCSSVSQTILLSDEN